MISPRDETIYTEKIRLRPSRAATDRAMMNRSSLFSSFFFQTNFKREKKSDDERDADKNSFFSALFYIHARITTPRPIEGIMCVGTVTSPKAFYMCLTRVWLIPGAARTSSSDGVKEKNWILIRKKKYEFLSFSFSHIPRNRSLRVLSPSIVIVIILFFFQEIKRVHVDFRHVSCHRARVSHCALCYRYKILTTHTDRHDSVSVFKRRKDSAPRSSPSNPIQCVWYWNFRMGRLQRENLGRRQIHELEHNLEQ